MLRALLTALSVCECVCVTQKHKEKGESRWREKKGRGRRRRRDKKKKGERDRGRGEEGTEEKGDRCRFPGPTPGDFLSVDLCGALGCVPCFLEL